QDRALHIVAIVGFFHQADAWATAALDLVEHARPRAVGEHRVFSRAKLEDLLQECHPFAHRPGTGERSEIAVLPVKLAPMEPQLRKWVAREAHIRIALVIAKENVE